MIADLPSPSEPAAIGWLFGVAVVAVTGTLAFIKLWDRLTGHKTTTAISPQPLQVESVSGPASKKDCQARHASVDRDLARNQVEHDNIWAKLGGMDRGIKRDLGEMERRMNEKMESRLQDLDGKNESRVSEVHKRVNEVLNGMSTLSGRTEVIVQLLSKKGNQ